MLLLRRKIHVEFRFLKKSIFKTRFKVKMVNTPPSTPSLEDEGKILEEALQVVKVQAFHMKKFLVL